ncbi:MAG TPA: hypothetical protein VGS22_01685 [Thermoanaerobaculia bacterium]|jgi:hypothetical protein|nr:hypothetical protein [Thermoanaerobaculia bacterium]
MIPDRSEPQATNAEWRLCELVDALAAELDCVADTLSLKSHARGSALSVQKLGLDLKVDVRVDERGVPIFRTVEPGRETCATLLKLDLGQVFRSQLEEVRKPLDDDSDGRPLSSIPDIAPAEVEALERLGIFTIDDLVRYLGSSSRISEVARRTGISEARLRRWVGLPFLSTIDRATALPEESVALLGGNLGAVRPATGRVIVGDREAEVISWTDRRIEIRLPVEGRAAIWIDFGTLRTNVLDWRPAPVDLRLRDLHTVEVEPVAGEEIRFEAVLHNDSRRPSGPVEVRLETDGEPVVSWTEPSLAADEERRLQGKGKLGAGSYTVLWIVDPDEQVDLLDRNAARGEQLLTVFSAARCEVVASTDTPRPTAGQNVRCTFAVKAGHSRLASVPLGDRYDPELFEFLGAEPAPDERDAGRLVWNDLGAMAAGTWREVVATFACKPIQSARRTRHTARAEGARDGQGNILRPAEAALEIVILPNLGDLAPPEVVERLAWIDVTTVAALAVATVEQLMAAKFTIEEAEHWIREAQIALGSEGGPRTEIVAKRKRPHG